MTTFYQAYDKRALLSAPQFNIVRHRYRGPRESAKINLEINQMTFSIYNLYYRFDSIRSNFLSNLDLLINGGDIDGASDSSDGQVTIDGLDSVIQRVISLGDRLKVLESQ